MTLPICSGLVNEHDLSGEVCQQRAIGLVMMMIEETLLKDGEQYFLGEVL
jgi:hypothetical protein